jgi:2-dehydro-3-deoxy-L-rhamnonate dehydrogenase (NAD+)
MSELIKTNSYLSIKGKVAVVTGGASGIGLATARVLLDNGAKVVLADYNEQAVQGRVTEFEKAAERVAAFPLDVSNPGQVEALFDFTRQKFGPAQLLVNSAGVIGPNMPTLQVKYADWQQAIAVNLSGTFLCCQAALGEMVPAGYGRIVNVASIAGKEGNPQLAAYSASKGAVIALTKSLAKEYANSGIYINTLAPAVIATPMNDATSAETLAYMVSKIPLGRVGQPEEVAQMIAWMLSDACSFTTGQCFDISGGRATY